MHIVQGLLWLVAMCYLSILSIYSRVTSSAPGAIIAPGVREVTLIEIYYAMDQPRAVDVTKQNRSK